jgi:hypothetical protein
MSNRWLVTLALAVVALPGAADAKPGLRVERTSRTVTTSRSLAERPGPPRVTRLPASVELDRDAVLVVTDRGLRIRHSLEQARVSWIATVGEHVVIGFAARPGGHADTMIAIDHVTGQLAWRRTVDSLAAAELAGPLLAVERAGTLDVIDARTGNTVGTTPLAGQGLQAVSRSGGDLHVKTSGDLIAIDRRSGAVRWVQPTSSLGNATVTADAVVDAWVDRRSHRFGIVSYDPRSGRRLASVDLGATGGWYDRERIDLSPDGPNDVLVSALFATL